MLSSPVLSISDESRIEDISEVSLFSSGIKEPLTTTSSISCAKIFQLVHTRLNLVENWSSYAYFSIFTFF